MVLLARAAATDFSWSAAVLGSNSSVLKVLLVILGLGDFWARLSLEGAAVITLSRRSMDGWNNEAALEGNCDHSPYRLPWVLLEGERFMTRMNLLWEFGVSTFGR